ncbi:MAG: AAA family ATPase [Pirellulales bacterium]|nr:AAA family ATPase [Pirellulales bacterium]
MKIATFNVDGYGVWSGLKIEKLSHALNVFYGPNEAGKTTLLQFIRSMLYGFAPRRQYFPPLHGGRPGGEIEVAGANGRFLIGRYQAENGGAPGEQLTLTAPDGTRQGEHFLKVILSNVDEAVFNNVFAVGLREIQELATLGDTAAAELLYNLSAGVDGVSLVDVLRELETSRNRVLDARGQPSLVLQLSSQRQKLLAEIEELSSINHRYARLAAECETAGADSTRLEEEANRAERLAEVMDLAAVVRQPWRRRVELNEQLAAIGPSGDIPPNAVERLDALNARIERRRRRLERIVARRDALRREYASLKINEPLRRQAARIEALAEQEPWIARLRTQIAELESEIGRLETAVATEAKRLGFSELPAALPSPKPGELASLRQPAKALGEAVERLNAAKRKGESARAEAESLDRQLQSSLTALGEDDLDEARNRAADAVAALQRRVEIDERIERDGKYLTELEERSRRLVDRQLLPASALIGLGAAFVTGVVLLLTGLFIPETIVGTAGLTLALLGAAGSAAAAFAKVMLERSNVQQLDACRKQIESVGGQIRRAKQERDAYDARVPGERPIADRTQAARRELAALEELSPLAARRETARAEAASASHRVAEAREAARAARRRWRSALAAVGMPDNFSPKQFHRLVRRGGRIHEMQRRWDERREELRRRRSEMESLSGRIAQIAAEAGINISPLPQAGEGPGVRAVGMVEHYPSSATAGLPSSAQDHPWNSTAGQAGSGTLLNDPLAQIRLLVEAAARQEQAVARREAIRRQAKGRRGATEKYEESIARLNRRRRELFIEAGVKDEQEYRRRALEQARGEEIRAQREEITREIDALLASRCTREAIARHLDGEDADSLDERREEARRRATELRGQLGGLLERRGRMNEQLRSLADDWQLAAKRLELAVIDKRLRDAVARWRTLATACRVLDEIRESYERHRQPETLRAASGYLDRFTQGRYLRVWTPLGERSLRVDDAEGRSLPVEALSRGTREQLFLSLRLALAESYARRGAPLPLILDDVLVNFDADRAKAAAAVLRDFAAAGHQLLVFTCHEHILKLFKSLKTAVARLPDNSESGGVVTLEAPKAPERPKSGKAAAKKSKPKPKPRRAAEIEVVEDDEEEQIDDESLWDEDDNEDDIDDDVDAAA